MPSDIAVMLFSDDLRVDDNPALLAASQHSQLLCVYVFDEVQGRHEGHWPATGPLRARFIWQSLMELELRLNSLGQRLLITQGPLHQVMARLTAELGSLCIYCQQPDSWYETQQMAHLAEQYHVRFRGAPTLLSQNQLPFVLNQMPESFTPFRKKVEANWPRIQPLSPPTRLPSAPDITMNTLGSSPILTECNVSDKAVLNFHGGEQSAWKRLKDYIWEQRAVGHYKQSRNGLLGADYSSKFSPWLAQGCLSPRRIYQQVKCYESRFGASDSTYWMIFELLWRDFFHLQARRMEADFFYSPPAAQRSFRDDPQALKRWCEGRTGQEFVDANMRELLQTGFMSNRGRQNVASYFIYELQLDWRIGAAWFEHQLIDYDAPSNYGNWSYIAGQAHDPRHGRQFDIDAQAQRYDPEHQYRAYWLS
ncbi:DASH family cryptochrome [Lacimicrobium sp. SS2-24]|uniref:DASH family cryptochrome n=1 Tax=Lacimicrobium sp. SS2-24 TaxID=2005569 RepID=UPI000B4BEB0B|nr:DASH family cryptochrome [Lacimicrobium sp. SS2-24]